MRPATDLTLTLHHCTVLSYLGAQLLLHQTYVKATAILNYLGHVCGVTGLIIIDAIDSSGLGFEVFSDEFLWAILSVSITIQT
ncbi:MAG: hypothetical protein ACJ70Z_08685 [Nitrososphaera sp.]